MCSGSWAQESFMSGPPPMGGLQFPGNWVPLSLSKATECQVQEPRFQNQIAMGLNLSSAVC